MSQASNLIILFAFSILISYLGGILYTRTKIPDIIWLLGFGVLIGPVLGIIPPKLLNTFAPLAGVVSVTLITFEAGMSTNLLTLTEIIGKSAALTLSTFSVLTVGVGLVSVLTIPEFQILNGLLLGTFLSGLSTVAIITILDNLKKSIKNLESTRAILVFDSTLVDPFRIVVALTLIKVLSTPQVHFSMSLMSILRTFIVSGITGTLLGVGWMIVLHLLRKRSFNYMLTLSMLFLGYYLGEDLARNGGGTIVAFMFGILLANRQVIVTRFGWKLRLDTERIHSFNSEIAFMLKSYYFVYLGVIANFNIEVLFAGLVLTVTIVILRFLTANIVGRAFNFTTIERTITSLSFPLGTSAIVFSQLPLIYGTQQLDPHIYPELVFPVVLGTVIFSSLMMPIIALYDLKPDQSK